MKPSLSTVLSLACVGVNLMIASNQYLMLKRFRDQNGTVPPEIVTKVVDGRYPFLNTVTVLRAVGYEGSQIADCFSNSIRNKSYVVQSGDQYYVLYSPHLQDLEVGAKVQAWFAWTNITTVAAEGKLQFISPVELISATGVKQKS